MKQDSILWLYLLAGPIAWFVSMEANFALAPLAPFDLLVLYLVSGLAILVSAGAAYSAWGAWRGSASEQMSANKALSACAFWLNAMFVLVILAQVIPNFLTRGS